MKSIRQLFRQPLRSALYLCISALAMAFFCLGVSIFVSAKNTVKRTQEAYTTIALPNNQTRQVEIEMDGMTGITIQSVLTPDMLDFITSLPEKTEDVEKVCRNNYVSGYSENLHTLLSAAEEGSYRSELDAPYQTGVFVVTVEKVTPSPYMELSVAVSSRVEQVLFLHEDYEVRPRLNFSYDYGTKEALEKAGLKEGETCLVYGINYADSDLTLRTDTAQALGISPDEVDWSCLTYDIEHDLEVMRKHGSTYSPVAKYETANSGVYLEQYELDQIDAAWMYVSEEGRMGVKSPAVVSLKEQSAEQFLASGEGALWREAMTEAAVTNQSVPVIGTDRLETIYGFHSGSVVLADGRGFTEQEYGEGSRVCLLSEALAEANGLKTGDFISLQYYLGKRFLEWDHNPPAMEYREDIGYWGHEEEAVERGFLTGQEAYEIVGIYRQTDAWSHTDSYAFTPNTVFVPNQSITCSTLSKFTGIYYALLLKNGSLERVQELAEEKGYPEVFYYFDQGYSQIADTLKDVQRNAAILMAVCAAVWIAVYLWYLLMYTGSQKQTVELMRALGAGRRDAVRHVFLNSFSLVCGAVIAGGAAAALLFQRVFDAVLRLTEQEVQNKMFSSVLVSGSTKAAQLVLEKAPQTVWLAAAFALGLFAVGIWLVGRKITSPWRRGC